MIMHPKNPNHSDLPNPIKTDQQSEKAWRVLMRILWLMIALLGSGIVWLYTSFETLSSDVNNRLEKIATVDTRLNDMDDRLFAMTSLYGQTPTEKKVGENHDGALVQVEMALANELYKRGEYEKALTALSAIRLQLNDLKGLSTPIKSALIKSLQTDIEYITALKNQPDSWQAHIIKMRDIQAFLRRQTNQTKNITYNDLLLHDSSMLLSLAISAATHRDKDVMTTYLQESKSQLEAHILAVQGKFRLEKSESATLETLDDALYALNDLLANSPKSTDLHSMQLLNFN